MPGGSRGDGRVLVSDNHVDAEVTLIPILEKETG